MNNQKRLKILQINKLYHPWVGGVEKVVKQVSEGLKGRVEIKVLSCRPRGYGRREAISEVEVHKTSSLGIFKGMPISPTYPYHYRKMVNWADIVHFHLPFPIGVISDLINSTVESKKVVTYHSDIVRQKMTLRYYRPFLERFLDDVDEIMPTSPNLMETSPFLRTRKEKCSVVPLSLNLKKFRGRLDESVNLNLPSNGPLLLFVGRLSYYKGVKYLLRAMTQVEEAKLLIVGDGELKNELVDLSKDLGIDQKVEFLGYLSDEQLAHCYQESDLFVLPSVEPSEAFGIVQLEAMASGLPVINTNLPTGVPYVSLDGKTGITVPPRDEKALVGAIKTVLGDQELYDKFSENALERVESKFKEEQMLNSIHSIYTEVTS